MHKSFFKYLTVGESEKDWGLYVTSVGYSKVEPNDRYPNQEHPQSHKLTWDRGRILNDYYIVFISKGKGVFGSASMQAVNIELGTCFFLLPGAWHRYKPDPASGWEEYWIGFNGYYAAQLMQKNFSSDNLLIKTGMNNDMLGLFHNLIDVSATATIGYTQQMAGITLQLLGMVHTLSVFKEPGHDPVGQLISKAKFILQESYENQVDMEAIARQLPMGYSSFRKAFKNITGESPNQYHLNLRINRAKQLLIKTALNISEIADQTGFESVYYFSKIFKKKTGVAPNVFRKQLYDKA
ncbi:helix-turn-helix domain-containing protein [Mucilaginibacter sp. JRF]|uniref:AraC family transcriptional regulator n=1 Tax=Mucilaginibacter sp. JRF TaxID=2780088 RepID=UPI001880930A|nr:AraC family transcriptional regulator [Mucilaginibacter sp. JRF]MBE9586420.1 helix-turn-helix domain-containing protein [Mucilaginibacter sp. JRF]